MYYRLKAEATFKGITLKELAEKIGMPYQSFLRKMKIQSFTLAEAFSIKEALNTDLLLEELFVWEER